ncbi:N-methyl-L-tryptophan oxidase [Paenibacillus sp. NEAU-GSW1]|uniref:N-methyl-L-tryptophan oxidase n=1 Tax=Paenibacillus sp. NEAU-GSW1 TaxID=2682486 RepID=UPI0012E1B9CE|nr:N-methyl-L-tryptophan oxidase [Paenibacillus sp. NEAU-GSW1]MUT67198.1 N-methyl-L-tryptophan oxidase [Paenibacillus sp. NEAU-GSW1]
MCTSYDVIVIGAGSMGMSAGYYLAKRGAKTLLIDAFDPPHNNGSHNGDTRLIRHAYPGGAIYTELALRSHELWNELEAESGEKLLVASGVLNLAAPDIISFAEKLGSAAAFGVETEYLKADEIRKRWPGVQLPEFYEGLYEPNAGYLLSERCVAAYRNQAIAAGAELLINTRTTKLEKDGEGVAVYTDKGDVYRAGKVIVSAGAWFKTVEPFLTLPIQPIRKTVGWFQAEESLFDESVFPGFTLSTSNGGYYGFPSSGGSGLKIGRHDTGVLWQPGEEFQPFGSYTEDEADIRQALESFMPKAAGKLLRGAVCKYEFSPDEDFIIDFHPELSNVVIAGGFSGHGFKFASSVGELLADLALKGSTTRDIGIFSLSRFR